MVLKYDNEAVILCYCRYTVVQTKNVYWVGLSSGQIAFESKDDEDDDKNVSSHVLYSTSAILTSLLLCFFCVIQ